MIEDNKLTDNFYKYIIKWGDNTIFINSSLEIPTTYIVTVSKSLYDNIIIILSYNLLINIGIIYLLCILTFVFTTRFIIVIIINHDLILNKVKSLKYSKFLHYILSKLLNIWKNTSVIWIYFILFNLF